MYENLTGKKIYIETLGCKVNQYESEAMMETLKKRGATPSVLEEADICIVNTCSVTNIADRKSRQMLHHARRKNPDAVICAAGCYVQAQGESLLSDGSIDLLIGNDRKSSVDRLLSEYLSFGSPTDNMTDIGQSPCFESLPASLPSSMTRAYLKIQDGCNAFCSYCIIPFVRGRIRNKPLSDILEETRHYAEKGIREVILTGIHLSAFDDAEKQKGSTLTLTETLQEISAVPGIERIRLSSLEPRVITPAFLEVLTALPKVCPHFHLSLQSASNDTLKRMNRHYTIEDFYAITELLRKAYERPALTTDVIVGFPGETDADFEDTFSNLEKLNFYEMHIFKYSRRKGTLADQMPDQIPEKVKTERSHRLLTLSAQNKAAFEESFRGENLQVLVEEVVEKNGKTFLRGHTERYLLADIPTEALPGKRGAEEYINRIVEYQY